MNENDEFDQENTGEIIPLFVSTRSKSEEELALETEKELAEAKKMQDTTPQAKIATLSGEQGPRKKFTPLLLIILIPVVVIIFVIIFIMISEIIKGSITKVKEAEISSTSIERHSEEVTVQDSEIEVETTLEIILDQSYTDANTGMTFYYPSDWAVTEIIGGISLFSDAHGGASIVVSGSYYVAGVMGSTPEETISNMMQGDLDRLQENLGTITHYQESIEEDVSAIMLSSDFDIQFYSSDILANGHKDVIFINDLVLTNQILAIPAYYEDTLSIYQTILANASLPDAE